ncbi:hypothetical protein ACP_2089 [Acidobacterium capsulatum ATCC 51196]|uniref:Uncharacterized protein n=1 Tax=Acidobacterium capsulatum (strain ATCC 51196 / DSM 11244 / BCRC 80197 / JCM 7670 / NBRC 15755 / NCIMB 13165 / 161) TaxID=240015 RepID=C1F926_ACIC5|nr:hypothetical protein ACP_2089 [Acidobacterium capsulatum ATCC 51196]
MMHVLLLPFLDVSHPVEGAEESAAGSEIHSHKTMRPAPFFKGRARMS